MKPVHVQLDSVIVRVDQFLKKTMAQLSNASFYVYI